MPLNLTAAEAAAATAADTDLDLALGEGTTGYHDLLAAWAHAGEAPYAQDGETAEDVRARWKIAFKAVIAALTRRFLRREEVSTASAADAVPRAGQDGRLDAAWIPAGAGGPAAANAAPPAVGYGTAGVGASTEYAREDHGHSLAAHTHTPAEAAADPAGTAAAEVATHAAGSDHPDLGDTTPATAGGAGNAGTAVTAARADHRHAMGWNYSTPQSLGLAGVHGSDGWPARQDHVHAHGDVSAEAPATTMHAPAQVGADPAGTAAAEVATHAGLGNPHADSASSAELAAHAGDTANPHMVTAAQAGADPVGTAVAEVAAHAAATDHPDLAVNFPAALYLGAGALGSSLRAAREDHRHPMAAWPGTPSEVGETGATGSSAYPARGDHRHAHGNLAGQDPASTMHRTGQVQLDRAWPGRGETGTGPYEWRNLAQAELDQVSGTFYLYLRTRIDWRDGGTLLASAGQVWVEAAVTSLPDDAWSPLAMLLGWSVTDTGAVEHAFRAFLSSADVEAELGQDDQLGTLAFRVGPLQLAGSAVASCPRALVALFPKGPDALGSAQAEGWALEWHPSSSPPAWWTPKQAMANEMGATHVHAANPPLGSAGPVAISAIGASAGASSSAAREDHVHWHGQLDSVDFGGTRLHALAVANGKDGFLSGSDKAKIDALSPGGFEPKVLQAYHDGPGNLVLSPNYAGYFLPGNVQVNEGPWSTNGLYIYFPVAGVYELVWDLYFTAAGTGRVHVYAYSNAAGYFARSNRLFAAANVDNLVVQGAASFTAGSYCYLRVTNYLNGDLTMHAGGSYSRVTAKRIA